jgi:hypothetical protein
MTVVSIDYSMTSPAICVYSSHNGNFSFQNSKYFFLTSKSKLATCFGENIQGCFNPEDHSCSEERWDNISTWALSNIPDDTERVFLEGYAFGAKGMVFNIAENTGMLKHKLWKRNIPIEIVTPSAIKKHATGKGNAKKEMMEICFEEQNEVGLRELLGLSPKAANPISDIIDAHFLMDYGLSL